MPNPNVPTTSTAKSGRLMNVAETEADVSEDVVAPVSPRSSVVQKIPSGCSPARGAPAPSATPAGALSEPCVPYLPVLGPLLPGGEEFVQLLKESLRFVLPQTPCQEPPHQSSHDAPSNSAAIPSQRPRRDSRISLSFPTPAGVIWKYRRGLPASCVFFSTLDRRSPFSSRRRSAMNTADWAGDRWVRSSISRTTDTE